MLKIQNYLNTITNRLAHNFQLLGAHNVEGIRFDMIAVHKDFFDRIPPTQGEHLHKQLSYEKMYFKHYDEITLNILENINLVIRSCADGYTEGSADYMANIVSIVLFTESIHDDIIEWLNKNQQIKYYSFHLQSWCEIRFIVIELSSAITHYSTSSERFKNIFDFRARPIIKMRERCSPLIITQTPSND